MMEKGKIVQSGTHEKLIEQEGAYKKLFCSQKELEAYSMKKRKAVAE